MPKFVSSLQLVVAGYIVAVYQHMQEERQRFTPGNTPVRRKGSSQTLVGNNKNKAF